MDKSLDDIISSKKITRKTTRRRTTSARATVLGNPTVSPTARVRAAAATAPTTTNNAADKIIVSNLPADVNEVQIKELFHSTVGPLKDVTLHYDSAGRSKGVASVHFTRKGDGTKAYQQYNNRLIDGTLEPAIFASANATPVGDKAAILCGKIWLAVVTLLFAWSCSLSQSEPPTNVAAVATPSAERPMKIEIVVDPTKAAPSLVSRVAPAGGAPVARTVGRPRRGRGGRPSKKVERPVKSAADLDAEMEDYTANNAPAATAA